MKKKICISLCCCIFCGIMLFLTACTTSNSTLYNYGLEMVSLMDKTLKNEEYLNLLDKNSFSGIDFTDFKANDYDTPIKTYTISVPSFDDFYNFTEQKEVYDNLPDFIQEQYKLQYELQIYIPYYPLLNENIYGYNYTEVTYKLTMFKYFNGEILQPISYLYIFEVGKPIIITFQNFNNKILATSQFLPLDNLKTLSDTREVFKKLNCTVSNYEK